MNKKGNPDWRPGGKNYKPPRGGPATGMGWGGPATGTRPMLEALRDGTLPRATGEALSEGKAVAREYRAKLEKRLGRIVEAYDEALAGDSVALKLAAAKQIEDRVFGKPAQSVDVTSDGAALGYVVRAPAPVLDADEWTEAHKPR